jgi:hypothetical protein
VRRFNGPFGFFRPLFGVFQPMADSLALVALVVLAIHFDAFAPVGLMYQPDHVILWAFFLLLVPFVLIAYVLAAVICMYAVWSTLRIAWWLAGQLGSRPANRPTTGRSISLN